MLRVKKTIYSTTKLKIYIILGGNADYERKKYHKTMSLYSRNVEVIYNQYPNYHIEHVKMISHKYHRPFIKNKRPFFSLILWLVPNLLKSSPNWLEQRLIWEPKQNKLWQRQTSTLEKRIISTKSNLLCSGVKSSMQRKKRITWVQTFVLNNALQVFLWLVKSAQPSLLKAPRTQWVCVCPPHSRYHCTMAVLAIIRSQIDTWFFSIQTSKSLAIVLHINIYIYIWRKNIYKTYILIY